MSKQDKQQGEKGSRLDADMVVVGSGPGGYTAAFRAADLGLKTVLVERYPVLGGVCVNVGCIPSKALLHAALVAREARSMSSAGMSFGESDIDLDALRKWKDKVVKRLSQGVSLMAKKRKVEVVQGTAALTSRSSMEVTNGQGEPKRIDFKHTILAIGSRPVAPPNMSFDHPRVMDSTDTLDIQEAPERLLIVGAGVNGLEAAMVYRELGSKITMVELTEGVLPGTDRDLAKVLEKQAKKEYEALYLSTKVTEMKPDDDGVTVRMEGEDAPKEARFDRVAIMVGRRPNGDLADLEKAGVEVDDKGFIPVDSQMRTNVENIFAIGDVAGHPMFAHKATYEGKLAAEVAAGSDRVWDTRGIPAVVYTDPELAWVGLTETEAKKEEIDYESATFPWQANGRTIASNRSSGLTKLLFDPKTRRVLGAGIVGPIAGDLISACALAIEMGADAEDIGLTIHPHPTYSETVRMAAERYEGTITDL